MRIFHTDGNKLYTLNTLSNLRNLTQRIQPSFEGWYQHYTNTDTFYWNKITKYNWHGYKNTDGLASNLVIFDEAQRVACVTRRQCFLWPTVYTQGLPQLQARVATKWSPINSDFSSLILIFHQYSVSKIHLYHAILQDSIRRHPGLAGAVEGLGTLLTKLW